MGCVEQSFEALNDLKNTSDALQDRVIQTYNLTNRQKDIISELQSLAIEKDADGIVYNYEYKVNSKTGKTESRQISSEYLMNYTSISRIETSLEDRLYNVSIRGDDSLNETRDVYYVIDIANNT